MRAFFQVTITIIIALTGLSTLASIGDTDVVFCDDIRKEAINLCQSFNVDENQVCYQTQVDQLVTNSNTNQESYGGEEVCAY